MARKVDFGKGLDALIPEWKQETLSTRSQNELVQISIDKINLTPCSLARFLMPKLARFANSIKEHGILQPLNSGANGGFRYIQPHCWRTALARSAFSGSE